MRRQQKEHGNSSLQPRLLHDGDQETNEQLTSLDDQNLNRLPKKGNSSSMIRSNAERDDLLVALMALDTIRGLGFKTMRLLFDSGLLEKIWQMETEEIVMQWSRISEPGLGTHSKQRRVDLPKILANEKQSLLDKGYRGSKELAKQRIAFVPRGHKSYPEMFERLADPPRWIFVKGSLDAIRSSSIVAVVGSRNASTLGLTLAKQCAEELAKRNIIVLSGLAKGIDEKAHLGATEWFGQSIAVLGHGISAPEATSDFALWNRILENEGSIVSEYLPSDPPSRHTFLRRNELQVALSRVVIPVECPSLESGTGATIRRALAIGTPVVGIIPSQNEEKSLELTRSNLGKLGIPIFTVRNGNSGEFWAYLAKKIPEHKWSADPTIRQDRFFETETERFVSAQKKLSLDDKAVDRFAERVKNKFKERGR